LPAAAESIADKEQSWLAAASWFKSLLIVAGDKIECGLSLPAVAHRGQSLLADVKSLCRLRAELASHCWQWSKLADKLCMNCWQSLLATACREQSLPAATEGIACEQSLVGNTCLMVIVNISAPQACGHAHTSCKETEKEKTVPFGVN